jgi:hypothetical protein
MIVADAVIVAVLALHCDHNQPFFVGCGYLTLPFMARFIPWRI